MRALTFFVLLLITAAAVYGAYYVVTEDQRAVTTSSADAASPLFPGLLARVNDVAQVTIRTAEETVTVARSTDGEWKVAEKGNYPADGNDVKETVVGVAQLRRLEPRTAKPELHGRLGVADVTEDGSEAIQVTLADAEGTILADVLRGKIDQHPTGLRPGFMYVRKAGDPQSWYAEGNLPLPTSADDWILRQLPQVERERVSTVTIRHPDGSEVTVSRASADEENFTLADVPEGREISQFNVNGIAAALEFIRHQDVAAIDSIDFSGAVETVLRTFDGLTVTVRTVRVNDAAWLALSAEADPEAPDASDRASTPAENETAEAEAATEEPGAETVAEEAARINQRFGPWAYQVTNFTATQLTRRLEDVLEDPPEEEPAPAAAEDAPAAAAPPPEAPAPEAAPEAPPPATEPTAESPAPDATPADGEPSEPARRAEP